MVSPADSMYSSDSIGSLDQLETGETDSYSNPSGDVGLGGIDISLTDTPVRSFLHLYRAPFDTHLWYCRPLVVPSPRGPN